VDIKFPLDLSALLRRAYGRQHKQTSTVSPDQDIE